MRILSLLIFCILLIFSDRKTDSPHGPDFRISCSVCHSSKGWQLDKELYSFDHNRTKMPLTGQHSEADCRNCHPTLVFSEAKTSCFECHNDVHQATAGTECNRCHTPSSWLVNNINDIHRMSRFPLLGAHATADCQQCHQSENLARFDVMGIECVDCHRDNYMTTTNPNHINSGISEDCASCHPSNSFQWSGSGFNHNFFPLAQAHATPKCADCHITGNYSDANPQCMSCHQTDYQNTTNPGHISSNFPVTCQNCHSLSPGWKPANFDHTEFPLTLGHATPSCNDCHIGGNYSSTPTDCFACHKANYDQTANPAHQSLGFSVNCTDCHTTNPDWKPASYLQHDTQSFPIYSGRHKGEWNSCTDCHSNTANYSLFSCIDCHEHNKTDMDNEHEGNSNYSYNSSECFRCHPRGNSD